jgi:hypothetical protein
LSVKYILQILWYHVRARELPKKLTKKPIGCGTARVFAYSRAKYDPLTLGRG